MVEGVPREERVVIAQAYDDFYERLDIMHVMVVQDMYEDSKTVVRCAVE